MGHLVNEANTEGDDLRADQKIVFHITSRMQYSFSSSWFFCALHVILMLHLVCGSTISLVDVRRWSRALWKSTMLKISPQRSGLPSYCFTLSIQPLAYDMYHGLTDDDFSISSIKWNPKIKTGISQKSVLAVYIGASWILELEPLK